MATPSVELDWSKGKFYYPGLVRLMMIGDGSCFFHSIAYAYHIPYRLGQLNGAPIDREKFIRELRRDLSKVLDRPAHPGGPIIYDTLSRGKLREFAEGYADYSLENMKRELDSSQPVDSVYIEFVSNLLNKDIYILDNRKKDVYVLGDYDLYYKGRPSIILLYTGNHYDLIGLRCNNGIKTHFSPNHDLIRSIQTRLRIKGMSSN